MKKYFYMTFYNMMIVEGLIAMIWAAAFAIIAIYLIGIGISYILGAIFAFSCAALVIWQGRRLKVSECK